MKLKLLHAAAVVSSTLILCGPAFALETVTLPQNSDGTPRFQDPDSQAQSSFSPGQSSTTVDGLGSFHFSMSSDPRFANDPGYSYRLGSSSAPGYGAASNVPGSEFYNPGYPFTPR